MPRWRGPCASEAAVSCAVIITSRSHRSTATSMRVISLRSSSVPPRALLRRWADHSSIIHHVWPFIQRAWPFIHHAACHLLSSPCSWHGVLLADTHSSVYTLAQCRELLTNADAYDIVFKQPISVDQKARYCHPGLRLQLV
jgi:hypothetical protein